MGAPHRDSNVREGELALDAVATVAEAAERVRVKEAVRTGAVWLLALAQLLDHGNQCQRRGAGNEEQGLGSAGFAVLITHHRAGQRAVTETVVESREGPQFAAGAAHRSVNPEVV